MPIDLLYSNYDIPRIQTSFLFSSVFLIVREHNLWEIARFRNSTLIFSSYCFSLHFFSFHDCCLDALYKARNVQEVIIFIECLWCPRSCDMRCTCVILFNFHNHIIRYVLASLIFQEISILSGLKRWKFKLSHTSKTEEFNP